MDQVLDCLVNEIGFSVEDIVFFSNDEIIIDMEKYNDCIDRRTIIQNILKDEFTFPLKTELFYLHKIYGTQGYCKEIVENIVYRSIQFKCLDNYMLPFVIRSMIGEDITESDKVFMHEGMLAKFIDVPQIDIKFKK